MKDRIKLFIHIPKNGGTSVHKESRNTLSFGHDRWKDIPQEIRYAHKSFAVIRNPWARIVSRYEMGLPVYNQPINGPPPRFMSPVWTERKIVDNYGVMFNSFEEFLETRHTWVNEWFDPIRSWHTQYDYVCDEDDIARCDILKLENIAKELAPYLGTCIKNMVKENVGKYTKDYKEYYNSKSIQIVADWHKKDIDYWGFDFDTSATKNTYFKFI